MTTEKIGPSDGSNYYQEGDKEGEQDKKKRKGKEKDDLYEKELKEAEEIRKEKKKREEKKLEQFKKKDKERKNLREEKEVEVGGHITKRKVYGHKRGMGIFIRNKTNLQKVKKGLKKVHGLSAKERGLFPEIVIAYNPTKIEIKKDKLKKLFVELKHIKSGRRGGTDFQKLKKTFDKDFLKKNFGNKKRTLIKMERILFGKKDPLKHKMKSVSNRTPNRTGKPESTSPSRNRF